MATGTAVEGEGDFGLDHVEVIAEQVTGRDQLRIQRLGDLTFPKDLERIQQVLNEVTLADDPALDQVVQVWYKKQLKLTAPWKISIAEYPMRPISDGFGISVDREGERAFSWEWFTVPSAGRAVKLQETGEISYEVAPTPSGIEMSLMTFDTDVDLRLMVKPDPAAMQPDWRFKIHAGSQIRWPFVDDHRLRLG